MISDNERLNLLLDLRRYADAEKAARDAISRDPQWAPGYSHLARALMGMNKKEAVDAAREGAAKAPHDAWAVATLACALSWFDMTKEALETVEEALRLDPHYAWIYALRANVLYNLGRYADARASAVQGMQLDPLSESLFRWKGWAEQMLGELTEARNTAEEGLKHNPDSHLLLNLIGRIKWAQADQMAGLRRVREHREADAILRESIRLDPTQSAYREHLRGNALSCRRHIVGNVLPLAQIAFSFVPVLVFMLAVMDPADPAKRVATGISCMISFGAATLLIAGDWFMLAVPLDRFRVPTVPVASRDRLLAKLAFGGYVVCFWAPYVVAAWALLL